jgi:hypothetical protein
MKRQIGKAILSSQFQNSIWGHFLKRFVSRTRGVYNYSGKFLTDFQVIERPHYAYCMLGAADLARRLKIGRISALEFGVAGGNGLAFMSNFAAEVERATGVEVECYGFDTGEGMPPPQEERDLPYWFKEAQYRMDLPALQRKLPDAKLVIGNVSRTLSNFVESARPARIGAIFNDVDYYSSTADTLKLFDQAERAPDAFMPRVFMYFDDIIGSELEMYGPYNGQLAAIEAFNAAHEAIKIHRNQNLIPKTHLQYRHQIYYAHLFGHPLYNSYVGGAQQEGLEAALKLG